MFSKTPDQTPASQTAPVVQNRGAGGNTKSVLAQDLRITGEISSTGTIEVLGEIEGNLTARGLVVGAEGRMTGTVSAETVEVKGKLDGRVATHSFALRASAEVAADVTYTTLVIESGASIQGKFALNKV
ncbi:MAG: polymer-forming cytoskeletal protein [bacterium]